jgi:hypothetical protein
VTTSIQSSTTAASGTSSAVDVSAFAQLRLSLTAKANFGRNPLLNVYLEHAPASAGPWATLDASALDASALAPTGHPSVWPQNCIKTFTVAGFDAFVRVRWVCTARANIALNDTDPGLTFALTAETLP